jgi:hypothetical protein
MNQKVTHLPMTALATTTLKQVYLKRTLTRIPSQMKM